MSPLGGILSRRKYDDALVPPRGRETFDPDGTGCVAGGALLQHPKVRAKGHPEAVGMTVEFVC